MFPSIPVTKSAKRSVLDGSEVNDPFEREQYEEEEQEQEKEEEEEENTCC